MLNKPQRHRGTEKYMFYNEEVTGKMELKDSFYKLCGSVPLWLYHPQGNAAIRYPEGK